VSGSAVRSHPMSGVDIDSPRKKNQVVDRDAWRPGAAGGKRIETPLNPVLYEAGVDE